MSSIRKQALRGAEGTDKTEVKCGECQLAVSVSDQDIQCEVCDTWFHCKCEGVVDETRDIPDIRLRRILAIRCPAKKSSNLCRISY